MALAKRAAEESHLTLDDAWRLTEAMIDAEAEWLPAWLGGTAPV